MISLNMLDKEMEEVGTLVITDSEVTVQAGRCSGTETGTYDLQGHWRLFKNETLLCVFHEGEMVMEVQLRDGTGRCEVLQSGVRYVIFGNQPGVRGGVIYRRYRKGELIWSVWFMSSCFMMI